MHDQHLTNLALAHNAFAKLTLQHQRMKDLLEELRDWHDERADADCDETHFIPNDSMSILQRIDEVLA